MLDAEQWAEIRRLYDKEGQSIKSIVRTTGISRNAVRRALQADSLPVYRRRTNQALLTDAVEPQIRELLSRAPRMPAASIARHLGWTNSMTILRERVRQLRSEFEIDGNSGHRTELSGRSHPISGPKIPD